MKLFVFCLFFPIYLFAAEVNSIGDRSASELDLDSWSKVGEMLVVSGGVSSTSGNTALPFSLNMDGNFVSDHGFLKMAIAVRVPLDGTYTLNNIYAYISNTDSSAEEYCLSVLSDNGPGSPGTVLDSTGRTTGSNSGYAEISHALSASVSPTGYVWLAVACENGSSRLGYTTTTGADVVVVEISGTEAVGGFDVGDSWSSLSNSGTPIDTPTTKLPQIRIDVTN